MPRCAENTEETPRPALSLARISGPLVSAETLSACAFGANVNVRSATFWDVRDPDVERHRPTLEWVPGRPRLRQPEGEPTLLRERRLPLHAGLPSSAYADVQHRWVADHPEEPSEVADGRGELVRLLEVGHVP